MLDPSGTRYIWTVWTGQADQNKTIESLNAGEFGINGILTAPGARKVQEFWDNNNFNLFMYLFFAHGFTIHPARNP